MNKLIILFCFFFFNSCTYNTTEAYEEKKIIQSDTLDIEPIKIETH